MTGATHMTLATSHLERMIDARTLSKQLGGKVTFHTLVRWARQGKVPGALLLSNRWWFDSRSAAWILTQAGALDAGPPSTPLTPPREPFVPSKGIPWDRAS